MAESNLSPASQKAVDDDDLLSQAIPIDQLDEQEPQPIAPEPQADSPAARKIRSTELDRQRQDHWTRKTTITGRGATHVKSFVVKFRQDATHLLDDQINAWLDEHPECEVKFVTTTIGSQVGKNVEPAVLVNLWV